MTEACEQVRELLAPYVLGATSNDERAFVERHVTSCAECAQRLLAYESTTAALASALPGADPPAALRRRIVTQAPAKHPVGVQGRRWGWPPLVMLAGASAAVLVLTLVGVQVLLLGSLRDLRSENSAMRTEISAIANQSGELDKSLQLQRALVYMSAAPGTSVATLKGQPATPQAYGMFMMSSTGRNGYLVAANLSQLPQDRAYHAWLIQPDSTRVSAGSFRADETGWAILQIRPKDDADVLSRYFALGVTVEPAVAAFDWPTTDPVIYGSLH